MKFNPINPQDYSTLTEFLVALKTREDFFERVLKIDKIIHESETEEECDEKIRALGFETMDIPIDPDQHL